MSLPPISEDQIYDILLETEKELTPIAQRFWSALKVLPQKWKEDSFGKNLGGFWVVGLFGNNIIWYNELEDGFAISEYANFGEIDQYQSYATSLSELLEQIVRKFVGELQYSQAQ